MNYEEIVKAMDDYYAKSTDEIRKELQPIAHTYSFNGLQEFCDKLRISKHTLYMLNKKHHTYRPSFEVYVRMKYLGPNPNPRPHQDKVIKERKPISKEDVKSYNHNYYMEQVDHYPIFLNPGDVHLV